MQILRTVLWIAATALLVSFISMNWDKAPVNLWPLEDGNYIHFRWPVGVIALIFFLLGFGPMWAINRTSRWQLTRRIASLENAMRLTATGEPRRIESTPETQNPNRPEGPDEN